MKFPKLHIIWTEGRNLALPDLLSRKIDEELFTKTRDITVDIPENIKVFPRENTIYKQPRMQIQHM